MGAILLSLLLPAVPAEAACVWAREGIELRAEESHILEGRIRVFEGEAWLRVVVTAADGALLAAAETPRLRGPGDWTYVAAETEPAGGGRASPMARARIELRAAGRAEAKDVRLDPYSPRLSANAGMEAAIDARGRIPFWSEEKDGSLLPGERQGTLRLDAAPPGGGRSSLAVLASGDWFGARSLDYPIPAWSDRFEIVARVRAAGGARGQILCVWADDGGQRIARVDRGPLASGAEWTRYATGPLPRPEGARVFRPVLIAHSGAGAPARPDAAAWFDDVEIITLRPHAPSVLVAVNQVGYEASGPKSAVAMTNFFPRDSAALAVEVIDARGEVAWRGEVPAGGRIRGAGSADWGWYFTRIDFSALAAEGTCRARAAAGGASGESFPFRIGRDLLFRETAPSAVDFFFVQRCGFEVPGWHAACHLDGARLPGGAHRDLAGGWHSAGDYNKITWEYGDGGAVYALAAAAAAAPKFFEGFDRDGDGLADILDEARWGARYLRKLTDPATGRMLGNIQQGPDRESWMRWVPPEKQTDNVPGTADDPIVQEGEGNSPLAIAGLALAARLLGGRGLEPNLTDLARRIWERRRGDGPPPADPLLLIAAVELHGAAGDEPLRASALELAHRLLGPEEAPLSGGYGDSGDIPAAALSLCALRFPETDAAAAIRGKLARHLDRMIAEADNAFGITRQRAPRDGDEGYFFEPSSAYGQNFLFACRAWSALLIHRLLGDRRALAYAADHLDFILGKNPYNLCMFEGKGSFNPPRYHHRYDSIPGRERGAVPGAIPNGFVRDVGSRDRPGFDLSTGGRPHPSYRTSEPWLVHDVFYLLALLQLHEVGR